MYNMLLCLFLCFTCLFAPIWHLFLACLYHDSPSMCFFACLLACFICLCMYTHGARTLGAKAQPLRHKQKGQGCKPTNGNDQQIKGPGPSRAAFSFPLFKPLLQSMYQGPHACTPFYFPTPFLGHMPWVWQCLFYNSCILLGHTLRTLAMSGLLFHSM